MLVCNVSLLRRRATIAAELAEAASASDSTDLAIFDLLVQEVASAADAVAGGFEYTGDILETATAAETGDGSVSVPSSTWNPSDKSANVALSNGNLTAQGTTTSDGGVRSTAARSSGKFYFEITWSSNAGGGNTGCGIATIAAVLSSVGASAANAALVFVSGNIYVNGSNVGSITMASAPFTICVAVDLPNSRIWFRSGNGNWNNSGTANPATNTGGLDISALFPTNAAYALMSVNGATIPTYTANFGATAFAQAVPSGFSAFG
jgi:hypothetical protein